MTQNGTYPTGTYVKDGKERVALSTRAAVKLSFEGYTLKEDNEHSFDFPDLAPVEDDDEPFELDDEDSEEVPYDVFDEVGDDLRTPRPSDIL